MSETTTSGNLIPATTKHVRAALKNNCLYVYHVWGEGMKARISNVRMHQGVMQVKHLQQGVWVTPSGDSRLVQQVR